MFVRIGADVRDFERKMQQVSRRLDGMADQLSRTGRRMTVAVTLPLVGVGAASLRAAGQMEQTAVAFEQLAGGAEVAGRMMRDLQEFAARTPFQFEGLARSSRLFLAFGFEAERVLPTLRAVGDAVAAMGGGEFEMQRVVRALGQIRAKGKVAAQEIMQLAEVGIPAWEMLARTLGVSIPEAMKRSEQGAISAQTAIAGLVEQMGARFQGMMQRQSQTILGLWSTFKDNVKLAMIDAGNALAPMMRDWLPKLTEMVRGLGQAFANMSEGTRTKLLIIAGLLAATGPIMIGLGLVAAHPLLAGATLAIAGIAALAAGFVSWRDRIRQTNEALNRTKQSLADLDLAEVARDLRLIGGEIAAKRIAVGASTQYRMLGMAPEAIRAATEQTLQRDPQYERLLERERELTEHYAALRAKAVDVALRQIRAQAQPPPGPPPLPQTGRDRGLMPYQPYPEYDLRSIIGMPGATTGLRAPVEIDATTREFSKAWMKATIPMANVADTTQDVNTKMGLFSSSISQVVYGLNAMLNILPGGAGGKWARVARIGLGAAGLVSGFAGFKSGLSAIGGLLGLQHGGLVTRPTLATVGERGPEAVIPLNRLSLPPTHVHLYLDGHELTTVVADRLPRELARRGAA